MTIPNLALRKEVITIYKGCEPIKIHRCLIHKTDFKVELLNLGRGYPLGFDYFRPKLHKAFISNASLTDEEEIRQGIKRAEFVKKEIEALYYLKRYRALRQRYDKT